MLFSLAGDDDNEPVSVSVDNCNDEYCEVKRSVPANLQLTFKGTEDATALTGDVKAQIAGMWIPFNLDSSKANVCKNLIKGSCPVSEDSEATYILKIDIPRIAPIGTRTTVQVRIFDQKKNIVVCTRFPVKVVN